MKISIIGTGYVGLVTGVCLADRGHDVTCVDIDPGKVDAINRGVPPIHEKGLAALLSRHAGRSLRATTDLGPAVAASDLTFIAVGTPFDGKVIDLQYVRAAAAQVGAAMKRKSGYHVVIVKSTVIPGTTSGHVRPLLEEQSGMLAGPGFGLGVNPEFLSEGVAIDDFISPDRIVLGGIDERTLDRVAEVYEPFPGVPTLRTTCETAEMIKYASNALQATMISFANEIGNLCATTGGIDVVDVMRGVHLMKELTAGGRTAAIASFLMAGCGFGGSCFPKDVKALVAHGQAQGETMQLLQAVLDVNAGQPHQLTALLGKNVDRLRGLRVAVLGLAFKPETDDMRESPAIPIVNDLLSQGAVVRAYDPAATREAKKVFGDAIHYAASLPEAVEDAEAVVIVTRWDEFRSVPELVNSMIPPPVIVDGRRMLDKGSVARYAGIGVS